MLKSESLYIKKCFVFWLWGRIISGGSLRHEFFSQNPIFVTYLGQVLCSRPAESRVRLEGALWDLPNDMEIPIKDDGE